MSVTVRVRNRRREGLQAPVVSQGVPDSEGRGVGFNGDVERCFSLIRCFIVCVLFKKTRTSAI